MKLVVGPLEAVPALCAGHRPSHLVSWLSPPDAGPEFGDGHMPPERLLISSHDITCQIDGFEAPCVDHLRRLLAFAAGWRGEQPMLVHCWAGVSRSTAAAYVIACQARADLAELELAQRLRTASPTATPNALIVALADELLGRRGRMSAAIAEIGRGAETGIGEPFVMDLTVGR